MSIVKKIRTALRQFDAKRRNHSIALEVGLLKLLVRGKGRQPELLEPKQVKRVLIVRNNKRIGNMFFLLPFVNYSKELYPNAEFDLLLSEPWQGTIFDNLGLKNVYYSQFGVKSIFDFFRTISSVKKQQYDLILLPYGGSSDRIVTAMLNGKNVVAFYGAADAAVCSHTFKYQAKYKHFALSCIELLEQLGLPAPAQASARLVLSDSEKQCAADELKLLLGEQNNKPCLAYFRGARGAKVIADKDWQALLAKFKQHYAGDVNVIEILSPDVTRPLAEADFSYSNGDLRKLAAFLQQVPLFFCGDTGPLHLASSAGAYCVGLFTVTNVAQYGCLGEHVVNVTDLDAIQAPALLAELGLD
ncbi:glycosyltransferase family 9 protein [Agarivorans sp. MS3-6]